MIEASWPYFIGFGTPTTLLTYFSPLFTSLGVYAAIFPFVLFLAAENIETADNEFKNCRK